MAPVLFRIGSFEVHSFGVMLIVAFLAGTWLATKRATRFQLEPARVSDMCFWSLILGIVGARLAYILQELPHYLRNQHELWSLQFAGLTSFGGLLTGMAVMAFFAARWRRSFLDIMDLIGPPVLLAWGIGRIGCLLNGCCYGRACEPGAAWCIKMPAGGFLYHYPAQLIDAGLNALFCAALLLMERRGFSRGQTFGLAMAFHGLARFVYEFARAGSVDEVQRGVASSTRWAGTPLTEAHLVAGSMVLIGIALYLAFQRRGYIQQEIPAA